MIAYALRSFCNALVIAALVNVRHAQPSEECACRITCEDDVVALESPAFVFQLDTSDGLRAAAWTNRQTGKQLRLGNGPEVEIDLGLPDQNPTTPTLRVTTQPVAADGAQGEAVFELVSDDGAATLTVTYRWDATRPVLRKFVTIKNTSDAVWDRLLHVRLGTYHVDAQLSGGEQQVYPSSFRSRAMLFGGLQGFPVYADDEFFLSLAHPAGWSTQEAGEISLRHYPGVKLASGATYDCMETVYGVGAAGGGREAFVTYVRSRTRRVVRGHDKPYAIFEPFGARVDGNFNETEAFVLDMLDRVAEGQRDSDCRFDVFSVDFWVDYRGDLTQCDPERFPNGLTRIHDELTKLDIDLGLWIDSSMCSWSVGGNPAVAPSVVQPGAGNPHFCRATEPIRAMYAQAFTHHIQANGARLLKFDNLITWCENPQHEHLPGIYSTEAIINGVIDCYRALDEVCPDVFIMLYWGYRSPWWLLYGDTMFETGVEMEAASPGHMPAPFVRDGVTRKLDQGHVSAKDVPWLGTDSLGVWLSHWGGWNSGIGTERWEPALVMDICRGSALAQPWSDPAWLSPSERRQVGEFIALMKARPQGFVNSTLILGDPWHNEPYGYCCSDGHTAFLALNNGTWKDQLLTLRLGSVWGLKNGITWDLYRWYPHPARLMREEGALLDGTVIALRPFEVVLLEAVPQGESPALPREFVRQPLPVRFAEPSRELPLTVTQPEAVSISPESASWTPLQILGATSKGGATLTLQDDHSILASGPTPSPDTYIVQAKTAVHAVRALLLETLPDDSFPGKGPGRAVNGNYMLSEIRVQSAPASGSSAPTAVPLAQPMADYAQTSHGGWPITAALDGDPATAWSIDPAEGRRHAALFHTVSMPDSTGNTVLTVELVQGGREHTLGRFRLWATASTAPALPTGYGAPESHVTAEIPATRCGGLLVVVVELSQHGQPVEVRNLGSTFSAEAELDGKPVTFVPALGKESYPSSWQAWRYETAAGASPQPVVLRITDHCAASAERRFSAYFLPEQR